MPTRRLLDVVVTARPVAVASVVVFVIAILARSGWFLSAQETHLDARDLQGRWRLETVGDQQVDARRQIYFEISGTTIKGYDGCNIFGGPLEMPTRIRVGQRGCAAGRIVLPLDLSNPAEQLRNGRLAGNLLSLPLPGGMDTATLRRDEGP